MKVSTLKQVWHLRQWHWVLSYSLIRGGMRSPFRFAIILSVLLLVSCSVVERQHLYREAVSEQALAEEAMKAGDTEKAIKHFRKAYVAYVDSGHEEAWPEVLSGIYLTDGWDKLTERAQQDIFESTRANLMTQARLQRQRLRHTRMLALAGLLLAAAAAVILVLSQRKRRLETERELLQARLELQAERERTATPALALALRSYEQLCSRYSPEGDNAALLREFRQQLDDLRDDRVFRQELEASLETSDSGLPGLIRSLPDLKDSDRRLMLYIAGGLPTYLIAAIFGKTRPAVNMQISRLRRQIESMDARIQSRMLKYFDKRSSGRPKK